MCVCVCGEGGSIGGGERTGGVGLTISSVGEGPIPIVTSIFSARPVSRRA